MDQNGKEETKEAEEQKESQQSNSPNPNANSDSFHSLEEIQNSPQNQPEPQQ